MINKSDKIYVAGHRGMAGSAIAAELDRQGYSNWIGFTSQELDLTDRSAVSMMFRAEKPDVVVNAAAKVGGIHANDSYPATFLSENLQIQVNIFDAANSVGVERLVFLGSSCIYPKFAPQPIKESDLMTGPLEPTNDGYAIAKIAGLTHVQASRRQFGRNWISAMPTNLYGPGDNFHPENSHVLAALLKRFHDARENNVPEVTIWGSGNAQREFMHVSDLASATVFLLQNYNGYNPINVGSGHEVTINDLALIIARTVDFKGKIGNDLNRPDGTPRKALDSSALRSLGWEPRIEIQDGISATYEWMKENILSLRSH